LEKPNAMTYIHTPTGQIVEAVQWKKTNFKEVWNLTNGQVQQSKTGVMGMRVKGSYWPIEFGEWIIKTPDGVLHVHSERYFEGHYRVVKCDLPIGETPIK
jgi:ribosomal protein L34E